MVAVSVEKFCKIEKKTPMLEFVSEQIFQPMSTTLIKKELQCRCFSANFVNFFQNSNSIKQL